jgi:hypothetical protein
MSDSDDGLDPIKYKIYEHPGGVECSDPTFGTRAGRAINDERDGFTEDSELECIEFGCEEKLVYKETVETPQELPDLPDHVLNRDKIRELSDYERAVLLGMVMESLRGSWTAPKRRLALIKFTCNLGVGDHLSDEFLEETLRIARGFWVSKQTKHRHHDGRRFRGGGIGHYGCLWEQIEKDPETMEKLSRFIPDDLTWDSRRLGRMENDG